MSGALVQGDVEDLSGLEPNQGRAPVLVTAEVAEDADLTKIAQRVSAASTPHRAQSPPSLSLVVYADLNEESAKKAQKALEEIEGVDAEKSEVDAEKGHVDVRLKEKGKITASSLVKALEEAGIEARLRPQQ